MDVSPAQLLEQAKERFTLQDYFGAVHLLEELIAGGRAFADAYHLLGLSYHLVGQPERALACLDEALRVNPRYVEALVHRGVVLSELGRSEEATEAFGAARETGRAGRDGIAAHHAGKLANQHALLGEAYAEAGAYARAVEQYERALELGPDYHDLRFRLGRLLLEAGRSLEAREVFGEVVEARAGSADAKGALGLACYLSGDPDAAREVWTGAQRDHPGDPRAGVYLAMLDRAAQAEE
ncbi:MAG: tetratricopeptide repeat protein [Gemmatimonadetes bacterium]|nr:tetratricopeptide repeat protein [Gemmatimonadota bacterium]